MFKVIFISFLFFTPSIKIIAQENCDTVYILFNKQNSNQTIPIVETFENGKPVKILAKDAKIYFFDYKYLAEEPNTKQKISYYIKFENMNFRDSIPYTECIRNYNEIKEAKCKIKLDEIDNYKKAETLLKQILGKNKTVYLIDYNNAQSEYIFLYKVLPMPLEPIRGNHQF